MIRFLGLCTELFALVVLGLLALTCGSDGT